jgi:membrane-associated phospholipid phosphatase
MVEELSRPGDAKRAGRIGRGVLAMVLFAVPVALLAFAVREQFDPVVHADNAVIKAATDATRSAGTVDLWLAVQRATQPSLLYCLATPVCLWAWLAKGLRTRAIWAFVTMMVAWNVGLLIKLLVQRARPVVQDPISHSPGYSFPSGHAFNAAVIATALVFLLWPLLGRVGRRVTSAVAVLAVLVVGLDRVFLGVHFPSDVLAGFLLGGGITFSSWLGFLGRTPSTSSVGPSHPA